MMVRIQLNILQSKLFDSFQYIIIFMLSLVCYLLLVIKISIILIDSTTLQLCWNMYHVCLEFVQKAIPCCRCIDCANFSKNCRNDSKITTFAKYRQWSLLQMQYGMWKRCWYKIWKHKNASILLSFDNQADLCCRRKNKQNKDWLQFFTFVRCLPTLFRQGSVNHV